MKTKTDMFREATSPAARAYDNADAENHEGHPAFSIPLRERTAQLLLTNTLSNTFYSSANEIAKETDETYRAILAEDPEFFARAIVYARNKGCMRTQPIVGLVYLSLLPREDSAVFDAVFQKTIKTPKDLSDFLGFARSAGIRKGLGSRIKRAAAEWLAGLSEYHAIKYPLHGRGISLADSLRMVHPEPRSSFQDLLYRWVLGKAEPGELCKLPKVEAYERLKGLDVGGGRRDIVELIRSGRLPHEVVTAHLGGEGPGAWRAVRDQMPHFALLRNLNTLERHGALSTEVDVGTVVRRLTDEDAIRKSRVLPFRYHTAWLNYGREPYPSGVSWLYARPRRRVQANQEILDALATALEISVDNLPTLPGNVVISNDVSDSMNQPIADRSTVRYCEIAGIIAATAFKKSDRVRLLPAGTSIMETRVSRLDSVMSIADQIGVARGGTDIGVAMKHVNENGLPLDTYLGVTDGEEWFTQHAGYHPGSRGFYGEWVERANKDAKAYLVRIDPGATNPAPADESSVRLICGWSPSVLDYILLDAEGMGTQVDAIRRTELFEE